MTAYAERHHGGLSLGAVYQLELTGFSTEKGLNYGWINGVRVFVPTDPSYGQGDRLSVVLSESLPMSFVGEVTENHGNFVHEYIKDETPQSVRITSMSNGDARHCVSEARRGFRGFFTVLNMTRYAPNKKLEVVARKYLPGKNGNYFIVAEPTNDVDKRDPEKCIFISAWDGSSFPGLGPMKVMNGVPRTLSKALFFGGDGRKYIVDEKGRRDISHLEDYGAVDVYRGALPSDGFRLVLNGNSRDPGNGRIMRAVEEFNRTCSGKALEAELLHENFFEKI